MNFLTINEITFPLFRFLLKKFIVKKSLKSIVKKVHCKKYIIFIVKTIL